MHFVYAILCELLSKQQSAMNVYRTKIKQIYVSTKPTWAIFNHWMPSLCSSKCFFSLENPTNTQKQFKFKCGEYINMLLCRLLLLLSFSCFMSVSFFAVTAPSDEYNDRLHLKHIENRQTWILYFTVLSPDCAGAAKQLEIGIEFHMKIVCYFIVNYVLLLFCFIRFVDKILRTQTSRNERKNYLFRLNVEKYK